jgi:hypothetical protein
MSNFEDQPQVPDPAAPVFRPGEFKGREGLVQNLLRRLQRGESLSIIGGPKLGKTSLLLHLAWKLNHPVSAHPSTVPPAVYVDVTNEEDWQQFQARLRETNAIFLLDNCDSLVEGQSSVLSTLEHFDKKSVVFAGMRTWRDGTKGVKWNTRLKVIPLAVFLEKEVQQLMSPDLSPDHRNCVLTYAGTHPFLTKTLQAEILQKGPQSRPESAVEAVKLSLSTFFQRCLDQLWDPLEHQVLSLLIEADRPVNPGEVAKRVGRSTIKPVADMLCSMGLIARWIREEEAAIFANSRLFNDWYREAVIR